MKSLNLKKVGEKLIITLPCLFIVILMAYSTINWIGGCESWTQTPDHCVTPKEFAGIFIGKSKVYVTPEFQHFNKK